MNIHQQNETVLSHSAVRKKENTVVNREKGSQSAFVEGIYIQEAALSSALSKADPAGIGTRANISTLEVNQNQDNEKNYDSTVIK